MSIDACYFPIKGLDDVLANKIGNITSGEVAGYRTLLEDRKGDKVTLDDYEELVSFIASINEEDKKEARRRTKLTRVSREAIIHKHLLKTFSPELLINRINMIATLFSSVVDSYASENPQYSREQIIRMVGFSNLILDVRDEVEKLLIAAENLKDEYKINEFNKVLNNWDALVYRAQPYMKTYEDVKLGQDFDFVVSANEGNYNENDLSWTFTVEESTREHWQTQQDFVSAFGSLGKEVRKALSRIHMIAQGGTLERDDLGVAVNLSPNKTHQTLLDVFRGVTSSTQMMEVLNAYQSRNPWARDLYVKLANDPILRTQFFVDLYKNFQIYSMQFTDKKGNLRTKILNRQSTDSAYSKYKSDVLVGKHFTKSIFSMNGEYATLNRVNIEAVNNKIEMLFSISQKDWDEYNKAIEKWNNRTNVFERKPKRPSLKFYDKNLAEQEVELQDIFNRLNISIDQDQLSRLMANNKDFKALLEYLLNLSRYSLSKISDYDILAEDFIKDNIYFKENITKIVGLISKYNNGLTMDARARFHGNTYQSNVTPSYMGDFFGFIENCVKNDDNKALLEFLQNKFLKSHTFMYNDVILNTWIRELIEGGTEEDSFASNFIWKKGLAIDDIDFEDFSANNHIKYLMTEYFSEREIKGNPDIVYVSEEDYNALTNKEPKKVYYIEHSNFAYKYNQRKAGNDKWERIEKDDYAYYPTFILGDANVAKFIKARRYSLNEIVDGFYNTYVSELRRQKNTEELEAYWKSKGISPNKNLIDNKNKFIMLPFLNKDYKGGKYYAIANKGKWYRPAIKAAIREYLNDSAKEFESKLISKKIIDENNSEKVHDYFYNTSFATIQQLQMMTIDVAFYGSVKDLQKRYKEIHAPGSILDVNALDPWNENKPVSDGIERVIYFKEVRTDAEETNPEFMRAIEKHFGEGSRIANLYRKNKSTDGQGYRTLESYRKVMIMAGKWNNEFENAYNILNTLRERARLEGRKVFTEEEMRVLDDVMVSFQPIKPYFYGFENIEGSNQLIPVQHKYAEAVLIPEFLPKDSSLRELAEFMEDNGIDMAGSTEIVKVGEYGSVDISKGNIYQTLEEGAITGSLVIHQLPYSSYRIQTNVPNHTHQSRLFGTQFRKLIMSNLHKSGNTAYNSYLNSDGVLVKNDNGKVVIVDGEGPVNLNKNGLTRFYNALIVGNIIESFNLFKQRAGDKYKLSSSAIYQIINNDREIKDNILGMSIDEFEDFVVPLFEGGIEHDAATMLFSIYKKLVNKQSILGGSAVQVSDFGITGKEESKHLKFVTDPNNPNNILYAECEIPFNFSYTDANGKQVDLKFSDYCNSDGTFIEGSKKGTTKIEEEFPGILDIIAYRIPTERAYSMMNLKVVRCSHPLAGGTIKVPSQGVTIAGFDFDVDKLYFMRNEFKQKYKTTNNALSEKDKYDIWTQVYEEHRDIEAALQAAKDLYGGDNPLNSYWELSTISTLYDKDEVFEEAADILGIDISVKNQDTYWDFYDTSKSPFQQSTTARNNMILHLSRMRLQDEETFSERYTPGGFTNASRAARLMRELEFSNHDNFITGSQVNLDGLKNDIDFDDTDSDPEPNYDLSNPMTIVTYNQQNQVAGKLIGIFANQNTHHAFISSLLECYLEIPIAFNGYPNGLKDLLHAPKGVDTSLSMAEFLAASVDAVKDPVLNFLNLNTLTADSGALLARLGYSLESIGLLFNQPIIKRLCEYSFDNNIAINIFNNL